MRSIKEILRLKYQENLSIRQIAQSCNCSRSTITTLLKRAEAADVSWPLSQDMNDTELEALLYPKPGGQQGLRPQPDFKYIHQELKRKSVTLQLLWQEYKNQYPDGLMYSQFCENYRQWRGKLDVCMRQVHRAGEKMFVDWAGQTMPIIDPKTGSNKDAYMFLAILGASNFTYAETFLTMDLAHWIKAHVNAFNYFHGVTEIVVPDNLKTGVKKPNYYEPDLNPTYQELAEHYRTSIIPARVRKPKDKSKVEGAVLIAERWILAALRNYKFFSLVELNKAVREKLEILNNRPFQKLEGCRRSLFEQIERPTLKPLPEQAYEFAIWKKALVNIDYHIEFEKNYYSTSYQLIKQEVDVRATANTVEIFLKGRRVAAHSRCYGKNQYITKNEHRPPAHKKYLEWTPERIINWAQTIGINTAALVKEILESKPHPEQGFRACLGIMRLGKVYPQERLERASARAMACHATSYKSLKSILEKGLDQLEPESVPPEIPIKHVNIRGAVYYNKGGTSSC